MKGKAHASIGLLTYYNYSLVVGNAPDITPAALSLFFSLLPDLDHYHSFLSKKLSLPLLEGIFESIIMTMIFLPALYFYKIKGFNHYLFFIAVTLLTAIIGILIKKSFVRKMSITFTIIFACFLSKKFFPQENFFYLMVFMGVLPWFSHRSFSHSLLSIVLLCWSLVPLLPSHIIVPCVLAYSSHIFLGDMLTPTGVPLFYPFSKKRFRLIRTNKKSQQVVSFIESFSILLLILLAVYLHLIIS